MKHGINNPSEGYFGRRCRNLIMKYTRDGIIKKPKICDKCGQTNDKIMAHHFDYMLPFDVLWMCPKCHRRMHSNLRILTPKDRQTILYNRMLTMKYMLQEALTGENIKEADLNIDINQLPFKVNVDGMVITMCKYCGFIWNIDNDSLFCPKCKNDITEKIINKPNQPQDYPIWESRRSENI